MHGTDEIATLSISSWCWCGLVMHHETLVLICTLCLMPRHYCKYCYHIIVLFWSGPFRWHLLWWDF